MRIPQLSLDLFARQVSPIMSACDNEDNTAQKRKVPSPFVSYSTSCQGIVELSSSTKRHTGVEGVKGNGGDGTADRSPAVRLPFLNHEQDELDERRDQKKTTAGGEQSPTLSMLASCDSMSAFAMGVASANGVPPLGMECKEETAGKNIIDQAVTEVNTYASLPLIRSLCHPSLASPSETSLRVELWAAPNETACVCVCVCVCVRARARAFSLSLAPTRAQHMLTCLCKHPHIRWRTSPEMRMTTPSQILPVPSPLISPLLSPLTGHRPPKMAEA